MRKLSLIFMLIGLMTLIVGCNGLSKSKFSVYADEDTNTVRIGAANALENLSGRVSTLVVEDGDKVVIKPNLLRGTILIRFTTADDDTENTTSITPVELEVSGCEKQTCELPAGMYDVYALVTEAAGGDVLISVE